MGGGGLLGEQGLALHHDRRLWRVGEHELGALLRITQDGLEARQQHGTRVVFLGLRIGIELCIALLHAALPVAQALEQAVHLGFDARHFLEPDIVHFRRPVVRRGEAAQRVGVGGCAIRQAPQAGVVVAERQLGLDQGLRALVRRDHGCADDALDFRHRLRVVELGGFHALTQRGHQHVLCRFAGQEALELAEYRGVDEARHQEAMLLRLLGAGDPVVDLPSHLPESAHVVADIGGVADRMRLAQEVHQSHMQAAELVEDELAVLERRCVELALQRPLDQLG